MSARIRWMCVLFLCTLEVQAVERGHDTPTEIFEVAIPETDTFDGLDLVVHAFDDGVDQGVYIASEKSSVPQMKSRQLLV